MRTTRWLPWAAAALTLAGCAGGWKNGAGPSGAAGQAAGTTAAPAAGAAAGTAATGDGVTFTYRGDANTVHLAGEFNGWNTSADPLTKQADGSWTITKKLEPGRYPYKFVVNGTDWKTDPNAKETVDDGFGGKNGVVVVGGAAAATAGATTTTAPATAATPAGAGVGPKVTAEGVVFAWKGDANTVALAGSFNGWNTTADPMVKQADGTWTITKKLPAGTHEYKFVINGTTWKSDDGNPNGKDDGFGGKNSLVTVN